MAPPVTQKGGQHIFWPHFSSVLLPRDNLFIYDFVTFIEGKARHIHFCLNMTMAVLNHSPNFCVENPTVRRFDGLMSSETYPVLKDSCCRLTAHPLSPQSPESVFSAGQASGFYALTLFSIGRYSTQNVPSTPLLCLSLPTCLEP